METTNQAYQGLGETHVYRAFLTIKEETTLGTRTVVEFEKICSHRGIQNLVVGFLQSTEVAQE